MNKIIQIFFIICAVLLIIITIINPAFAVPGDKIAIAMLNGFWGKIILFLLIVFLIPIILYKLFIEYFAQRSTIKDLRKIAQVNQLFDWLTLRNRITNCFYRIHATWHKEDLAEASKWMSYWLLKNQQHVYLNQWAKKGLINHCRIKKNY